MTSSTQATAVRHHPDEALRSSLVRALTVWCGDPAAAEDLTQRALLAAWTSDHQPDAEFERFAALTEGRTAIMISHRLGPARYADRVIVMDGGRIVEAGDHTALLAKGGVYARMFAAQVEWYNSP